MKKRDYILCAALGLLAIGQTLAQQLSPSQAKAKAEAFLSEKSGLRSTGDLQLLFSVTDTTQLDADATGSLRAATEGDALLYAFGRATGGYVIAAGDERAEAVLGYSAEGTLRADRLPEGMRGFLRQYAVEIARAQEQDLRSDANSLSYNPFWKAIDPLITSQWNQMEPYNRQTPTMNEQQCLTGCPAVVLAQLMDYYQYQNWKVAKETWYSSANDGSAYIDREVTVQFTDTVDWSLLKRNYGVDNYTEAEANEVAKLMKYTGAAMHINYGASGSGQQEPYILWNMHRVADYGRYASQAQAWQYALRDWSEKLYRQLAAKRPVAYASGGGGHIFLLDGYAGEGYFHFNWGWGGYEDGYFRLTALLPEQKMHFGQFAYFDVCPSGMEPLNEEPLLLEDVTLDTTAVEPQMKIQLFTYNPAPQSGTLCYAIGLSEDSTFVSDSVQFTLEADKQVSEWIKLPFPQYQAIEPGVYPLAFFQQMSNGWQEVMQSAYVEFYTYLVKRPEEAFIGYLPYYVEMKLDESSKALYYQGCADTLSLQVTHYGTGMTSNAFIPVLFNETDTFQLAKSDHLLVEGLNDLRLPIRVSNEIPVGDYRLTVINDFEDSSDTISVLVNPGVELVITEAPTIADTLFVNANNVFSFKVKNVGVLDFSGMLSTGAVQDGNQLYLRSQSMRIAVGEEQTYTGGIQSSASSAVVLSLQQDKAWPLALESGELFEKKVVFIDKPTANEAIAVAGMGIAWQGQTLCVESAAPLRAYHIYNVKGGVVAAGSASGNELCLDGSAWPTGIYFVAIETADGKRVIQKTRK